MNRIPLLVPALIAVLLCVEGTRVAAQPLSGLTSSGVDASLIRLFGEHKAFSADAVLTVQDKNEQELLAASMGYAVRDGKVRMDVDISKLRSRELPAGVGGSLKQLGMEKVVSLTLPGQHASYLIYPGLESVLKVPMDDKVLKVGGADLELDRVAVGRETIEGHACIRYRVTVTDPSGAKQEADTWNASDLQDFPLQIMMADGDNQVTMRLRNVRLTAPAAERFAIPASYTQYDSQEALMQAVMMKVLGGLGKPGEP